MKLSALLLSLMLAFAAHAQTPAPQAPAAAPEAELPPMTKIDVKVGTGAEADIGKTVVVNYTGWLYKPLALNRRGKQFDSSVGRGPFDFVLGAGKVIKGWDQGILGMKVGGKRTLVIPAHLAYGKRGSGPMIGPDADLIFDVELLEVK